MAKSKLDFKPDEETLENLKLLSNRALKLIKEQAKKSKINLEVFVGGSFAKDTLVRKEVYDIDIFLRLGKKSFQNDVKKLPNLANSVAKQLQGRVNTVHGSRDYYQISMPDERLVFEIIPVLKIMNPEEAENVTDLSYFHVKFIRRKLNTKNLREQVRLAKAFTTACNVYGAESYIQGFSGYALECLIVHYKSFEKMLRELSKAKETIMIDSERHYKNKKEIMFQLNESKLQSPVIVIDPTWRKRNALASLSKETFEKFQRHARNYLKSKSPKYFEIIKISKEDLQRESAKLHAELLHIILQTDKQEGDIAGTKLKKASRYIEQQLNREFDIKDLKFIYDGKHEAQVYIIGKPKKEIIFSGPPTKMEKHAVTFRQEHGSAVFEKKGRLYARKKATQSMKEYFSKRIASDVNLGLMSVNKSRIV